MHTPAPPDYERIGRFVFAFHRAGVTVDELHDIGSAADAPAGLAARARALAAAFDAILQAGAKVDDAEIAATLSAATALGPAIGQWRGGT